MSLLHHILWVGAVKPSLHHCSIVHKVHSPAHLLPLVLVSGPAAYQVAVAWDHPDHCDGDQGPMLGHMPAPRHIQMPVVLWGPPTLAFTLHPSRLYLDDDGGSTAHGDEDVPHLDNEANLSQGTLSLPDTSASDDEDTHEAIACEAAWKSNIQYGTWRDEQICQGDDGILSGIRLPMIMPKVRKNSKAPDNIGPPLTYMEECMALKPLDTMANLLGLCQFYHADPETVKSVPAPKPPAGKGQGARAALYHSHI